MPQVFAVIREHSPRWDDSKPIEEQVDWRAHADFMDALFAEDFVAFAGPLSGTREVLVIVRANDPAEVERRLAEDPWTANGLLETKHIRAWQLRLGSLGE